MKVLILSGRFGMGHEMAANAIREEFRKMDRDIEVIQKDLLTEFYPRIIKVIYGVFRVMAEHCHGIYNLVYRISGKVKVEKRNRDFWFYHKLNRVLGECRPDVIVCTHPLCEKAIASYKEKTGYEVPLITCITDISVHPEWIADGTDIYLAPTREVKKHLIEKGIYSRDILVTGIPVRQQFLGEKQEQKMKRRDKKVLIMGGGLGIVPHLEKLLYFLHGEEGVSATVISGKNKKLYERWHGCFEDIEVLEYIDNISDYMRQVDLVITKAGGITLFELIHCEVPLFVIHPFLEQEMNNAKYAENQGFAKVIWKKKEDFTGELREILDCRDKLEEMKEHMAQAKKEILDISLEEAVLTMAERAGA